MVQLKIFFVPPTSLVVQNYRNYRSLVQSLLDIKDIFKTKILSWSCSWVLVTCNGKRYPSSSTSLEKKLDVEVYYKILSQYVLIWFKANYSQQNYDQIRSAFQSHSTEDIRSYVKSTFLISVGGESVRLNHTGFFFRSGHHQDLQTQPQYTNMFKDFVVKVCEDFSDHIDVRIENNGSHILLFEGCSNFESFLPTIYLFAHIHIFICY